FCRLDARPAALWRRDRNAAWRWLSSPASPSLGAAMWYFIALVIDGALAGAIYALIALAFVLVYKASAMMNFALGEWVVFGAMLAGMALHHLDLGVAGALIVAAFGMIALAAGFYQLVVRRLVARPALSAIMATLGLGMVMRGTSLLL